MAQKAIIHTATRVIRRLTTDDIPQVAADETAVALPSDIDLAGAFKKLDVDDATLLVPTQAEIDASGVDDSRNAFLNRQKRQAFISAIDALLGDALVSAKIKTFLQTLKDLAT